MNSPTEKLNRALFDLSHNARYDSRRAAIDAIHATIHANGWSYHLTDKPVFRVTYREYITENVVYRVENRGVWTIAAAIQTEPTTIPCVV